MSPCTPVIWCRAGASSLQNWSTTVLADLMYLMSNWGYCINRWTDCEGDVGWCNPPNASNQTSRIAVRGALRVPR